MKWSAPFRPIGKVSSAVKIREVWTSDPSKKGSVNCCYCGLPNIDWCYNCERPICGNCSSPHIFLMTPFIGMNICKECEADNVMGSN